MNISLRKHESGQMPQAVMHLSIETPTPPHPGPRWGFDLTSLQILANPHPTTLNFPFWLFFFQDTIFLLQELA